MNPLARDAIVGLDDIDALIRWPIRTSSKPSGFTILSERLEFSGLKSLVLQQVMQLVWPMAIMF